MISNTSYKPKASKSSRELDDFLDGPEENISEEEQEHKNSCSKPHSDNETIYSRAHSIYGSREIHFKPPNKPFDYRTNRGAPLERRNYTWRGRGGYMARKYDHSSGDVGRYIPSKKFQEPLNKHSSDSNSTSSYHSKHYDSEKSKYECGFNFLEDTRISKLIRRLTQENDQDKALALCKKLLDALLIPDNARYVRRAFTMLAEALFEVLRFGSASIIKRQSAKILGRIGYVMETEFQRFVDWMFSQKYSMSNDEVKVYLIKSLKETMSLERKNPRLQEYAADMMMNIQLILEATDNPDIFVAALEDVLALEEIYPDVFTSHFRDTVDILLGWQVDGNQTVNVIEFVSKSLVKLSKHWQNNVSFSLNLMSQFLEDMELYSEKLHNRASERSSPLEEGLNSSDETLERITSWIRAFSTVVKCVGDKLVPQNSSNVSVVFVSECLEKVLKTVTDALDSYVPDNLAIAANECVSLLLGILQGKAQSVSSMLYTLIDLEVSLIQDFTDPTLVSMLLMISKVIKELSANLPTELVQKLVGANSELLKLRFSGSEEVQCAIVDVYHSLLNLKNIPLLQEAYRCVLGELEQSYRFIVPSVQTFCDNNLFPEVTSGVVQAELTCLFLLRCLSLLANASSSIIGMWALRPSMLELLALKLEPHNVELSVRAPSLQYCILYLLYSHSKCYGHFVSSSKLVSGHAVTEKLAFPGTLNLGDVSTSSPSAGNLTIILDTLNVSLSTDMNTETKVLLFHWLKEIFLNSQTYLNVLSTTPNINDILQSLINAGYSTDASVAQAVCDNLIMLLSYKHVIWKPSFYDSIYDLCALHVKSVNATVSAKYTDLLAYLPWHLTMRNCMNMSLLPQKTRSDVMCYNNNNLLLVQHLHMKKSIGGEMLQYEFKKFMHFLLRGVEHEDNWLEDIFSVCSPLESDNENAAYLRNVVLSSKTLLYFWATWEAALLCVNHKLRTPLGKPTETFMSIENALKQLSKEAVSCGADGDDKKQTSSSLIRMNMLLEFMEHLEKVIYNASEGCAEVLLPPRKPVRMFFHTNASTCREWLTRTRFPMMTVALYAGQSSVVIRHAHMRLRDLLNTDNTKGPDFEKTLIILASALLSLGEAEALRGLYVWAHKVSNKKFPWLKVSVHQASSKYETAIAKYQDILRAEAEKPEQTEEAHVQPEDSYVDNFINRQILNCYKSVGNWSDLANWAGGMTQEPIEYSFAQNMTNFEKNGFKCMNELIDWKSDEVTKVNAWNTCKVLQTVELDLCKVAMQLTNDEETNLQSLNIHLTEIELVIQEFIRSSCYESLPEYLLMYHVTLGLKNIIDTEFEHTFDITSSINDIANIDSSILTKILFWTQYFKTHKNEVDDNLLPNLLNIAKIARKQGNVDFAEKQIQKYLQMKKEMCVYSENNGNSRGALDYVAKVLLQSNKVDKSIWTCDNSKAILEMSKSLYLQEGKRNLALNVCSAATTGISTQVPNGTKELREIGGKMLRTLAKWIQRETDQQLIKEVNNPLGRLVMVLPDVGVSDSRELNIVPSLEAAAGKLLHFGVRQYPDSAKMWNAFGEWCYLWGKNIIENSNASGGLLLDADRIAIQRNLPPEICSEHLQRIFNILSKTRTVLEKEGNNPHLNVTEIIENLLEAVPILHNAFPEQLSNLIQVWRQIQKRIYHYYELSAEAFFHCLQLYSDKIETGMECLSITATLRLLRFIVKHAMELQSVLDTGLAHTPTHPWKAIIPQLFSRLNHPEEYVRLRVSELLCRIAEVAPHLIIFPAVVGAVEGGHKFDLNDISMPNEYLALPEATEMVDMEEEFDDSENEESRDVLHSCFMSMVETLRKQAPETITQVQLFVNELRRISLLWDELWMSTLVQHHAEITKRFGQLETEIMKTESNNNLDNEEKDRLIAEKHRIIILPIVFILEQLNTITSREPETPHEKAFQERYQELINDVLEKLKNPENPHKPQESWQPLKLLQCKLQQRAHKRTSFALKMTDISPSLASMRDTVIAMPGLRTSKNVTILSISHQINVLPTKTKPKKLFFHGSDGQTYTYLFKGMEDLHLDERIMQFLTIANTMMVKSSKCGGAGRNVYRARHYSVIPLGLRSGLISWVDGTTPLFSLYKRWQLRSVAAASTKQGSTSTTVPLRPSELFYNKLNPLLKEHGVKNPENRKEWPVSVLKQVLIELMADTPSDLLARELWCRSLNAAAWWQVTKNYSYSVAVMSIIGYIIGLGDRHLDNVLIDLSNGEVIHIDYNVCFEKGKQLRVPEKVPFRMTPNMENALGITGTEGIFRLACENVLDIMQRGRETLLTLLEAFVYDPLLDWTPGAEGLAGAVLRTVAPTAATKQARRDLERDVTVSMFRVRCAEMQTDWISNRDDILSQIVTIVEHNNNWSLEEVKLKQTEDNLLELHQQMALIKEAEYHGRTHSLYTLPKRFSLYQQTQKCLRNARKGLEEKIIEYENHIINHANALNAIRGPQLTKWLQDLNFPIEHENHKIFDVIKEFLQNAGQTAMITQCEQVESEVAQLAQQQLMYIRSCLDLLGQYGAIAGLYPVTYLEKHRSVCYVKWCQRLLDSKTVETCHEIVNEYNLLFSPESVTNPSTQQVVAFSYQLQTLLNDTNICLQKSFERLSAEGMPDSGSRLDKAYNDTLNSIANFLHNEKGATKAFECVNITALCALNKRYLTMEAAAASAGDYLVDLTSREGDWFLDEMHLMSSLVTELSNLLPLQHNTVTDDARIPIVLNCLKTANNIYKGLQELNYNFHTIILPETMKTIQTEDGSVLSMINDINNIILNVGYPLPEIMSQLERHLRFTVMEMDSPHGNVQNLISDLRKNFEDLLHAQTTSDALTPGQMLLMGFNGLFEKLQVESNGLIMSLASLETPACWKKVDQFREAKSLSAPVFNEQTRSVLDDIFMLKRVQTMSEFFSLCGQMCRAFKGIGLAVYDDERLSKPIRRFCADYVSRQLLGVTSQTIALALCFLLQRIGINVTNEIEQRDIGAENKVPLEELCRKAVDLNLKCGVFTGNVLAQASGLCSNLETTWRKREVARYMQQNVETQRSTMQRLQLQLTAHHWFHEDIIMLQPGLAALSPLLRSSFLLELRKSSSALLAMQSRLAEAREQQRTLIASAEQRLKWAAGANPDLHTVMASFECAVNIREDRLSVEQKLGVTIGTTCNTLLQHEALRTRTSEAVTHDTLFVNLIKNWESSCRMIMGCTEEVTSIENSLLHIVPLEGNIDQNWIRNASVKLSELISEAQKQNTDQKENMMLMLENIKMNNGKLKNLLCTHHKLISDVRNLLKTMLKMEDSVPDIHRFLRKYSKYLEIFMTTVRKLNKDHEVSDKDKEDMFRELSVLKQQTTDIYDQLLNLGDCSNGRNCRPPLIRQESVWLSPGKGVPEKKLKQGKEQRNAYAIAVWHKVRMKLEGRDPDPGVKYSLQEQVEYVIKEAKSLENLALLYEGWTPWV